MDNVGQGIGDLFGNGKTDDNLTDGNLDDNNYKYIPLKDPKQTSVDENLENFKNDLLKKAKSFSEDADKMADDLIKETDDVMTDAGTDLMEKMDEMKEDIMNDDNSTPKNSINSLGTGSPEPEIERILANDTNPPTPVPNPDELPITDEILTIIDNKFEDMMEIPSASGGADGDPATDVVNAGDSEGAANQQEWVREINTKLI